MSKTKEKPQGLVEINIRNVDPEIRRKFKLMCVTSGVTMQDTLCFLMEQVVRKKIPIVGQREEQQQQ